jgi:hypothetical protein
VNLFDVTKITENSIVDEEDGRVYARSAYNTSPLIAVDADSVYFNFSKSDDSRAMPRIAFYDENDSYLSFRHDTNVKSPKKFDLPTGAKKIRFSYTNGNGDGGTAQSAIQSIVLTDFDIITDHYIPYYNTETPIYIGDSQLMEGEYVDYEEQKIYKLVDGTLTPTDPPVHLPDITLPQATVTIDIDGDPKPQATIKGKIEQTT